MFLVASERRNYSENCSRKNFERNVKKVEIQRAELNSNVIAQDSSNRLINIHRRTKKSEREE